LNKLILFILSLYKIFFPGKWQEGALRILINEKKTERLNILQNALKSIVNFPFEIKVPKNKFEFIILAELADVIFSYGLSRYVNPVKLKLYYHSIVGDVSKSEVKFKIISPPNFAAEYLADYVLATVISYEKKLLQNAYLHYNRNWKQKEYIQKPIRKLSDLKIGILGLGRAGSTIASRFLSLNCKVFGSDVYVKPDTDQRIIIIDEWKSMLHDIDYFVIAVSDIGNENLVNKEAFSMMNQRICIVNISRMKVIDENELIYALRNKRIRGAILDVFSHEPLPSNSIYFKFPNVVVTPHIAGNIDLVFNQIALHFAENVKSFANV